MNNFLFYSGVILGGLSLILAMLLGTYTLLDRLNIVGDGAAERKARKISERDSNVIGIFAVKVPSATHYYTPVAYMYGRKGEKAPVVTIIGASFFKKLPPNTPVFCLNGRYKGNITLVGHIRYMHKQYLQSIKEAQK